MADQPKAFCVVPVEPSEEMLRACYGAISKCITSAVNEGSAKRRWNTSGKGFKILPRAKAKIRWSEMLAARGPEAEAMVPVPRSLLNKLFAAIDADEKNYDDHMRLHKARTSCHTVEYLSHLDELRALLGAKS